MKVSEVTKIFKKHYSNFQNSIKASLKSTSELSARLIAANGLLLLVPDGFVHPKLTVQRMRLAEDIISMSAELKDELDTFTDAFVEGLIKVVKNITGDLLVIMIGLL